LLAVVVALAASLGVGSPAYADPEDGDTNLRDALTKAAIAYNEAKVKLDASKKKQAQLRTTMRITDITLVRLNASVSAISSSRYKGSTLSTWNGLLDQTSPENLLQGMAVAGYLTWRDNEQLHQLTSTLRDAKIQADTLAAVLKEQEKAYAEMDRQKRAAEKALAAAGGMVTAGFTGDVPDAQPAVRRADGSLPPEGCSYNDPTTTGCISPRTYHMLTEARLAGFTRYTACFRHQSWGEHPLGKACDFSAAAGGFQGVAATGSDRVYGNRLAAWAVKNSYALGVLYVIWYRQIWMPGLGWRSYSGCCDPASSHTNHVHISMQ
jgi:hypothetical protein